MLRDIYIYFTRAHKLKNNDKYEIFRKLHKWCLSCQQAMTVGGAWMGLGVRGPTVHLECFFCFADIGYEWSEWNKVWYSRRSYPLHISSVLKKGIAEYEVLPLSFFFFKFSNMAYEWKTKFYGYMVNIRLPHPTANIFFRHKLRMEWK